LINSQTLENSRKIPQYDIKIFQASGHSCNKLCVMTADSIDDRRLAHSGGDQWRRQDLVSGGTTIETPKARALRRQKGCPLPNQLGSLGERREVPQRRYRIFCMFRPQNASGSKKNTILLPKLQSVTKNWYFLLKKLW